ncbi:cation/H+ exchanger, Cation/H+ exchanger, CPA1 family [Artemisia annua]|uniref:Cation/H+ exchanger, Cation/H+ exchanger, CPA1 family n=1 Tax=Artemisia annua TaxID=35608 RepID=A0A2U1PZF0_ARTAN|nr:cation/H+ exchanger, Cation/H+ exchanger, CPA1 family [Artemisia annua]
MDHSTRSSKQKNFNDKEHQAIYESLLEESVNGGLKRGSIGVVADKFGACNRTVSRIWHQSKLHVRHGLMANISSKKANVVGRKKVQEMEEKLEDILDPVFLEVKEVENEATYAFATLSFIAETFIFLYVGMDAHDCENWKVSTLSIVMLLIALGRVAFVFPLSILSNYMHRSGGESSNISSHPQVCQSSHLKGFPKVCLVLEGFLEQHVSEENVARRQAIDKLKTFLQGTSSPCTTQYYESVRNAKAMAAKNGYELDSNKEDDMLIEKDEIFGTL